MLQLYSVNLHKVGFNFKYWAWFNISAQVFLLDSPLTVLQYSNFLGLIVHLLLATLNGQNLFSIIMQTSSPSCADKIELLACSSFTPPFPFLLYLPFSSILFLLVSLLFKLFTLFIPLGYLTAKTDGTQAHKDMMRWPHCFSFFISFWTTPRLSSAKHTSLMTVKTKFVNIIPAPGHHHGWKTLTHITTLQQIPPLPWHGILAFNELALLPSPFPKSCKSFTALAIWIIHMKNVSHSPR